MAPSSFLASLLIFLSAALSAQINPFLPGSPAQPTPAPAPEAQLQAEVQAINPGEPFTLALTIDHPPGWHSYFLNPGFIGEPLQIGWELPEGFQVGDIQWPVPHQSRMDMLEGPVRTFGYEGQTTFLIPITPPNPLPEGPLTLSGLASWQICDVSNCQPRSFEFNLTLPRGPAQPDPAAQPLFQKARAHLPQSPPASWQVNAFEKDNQLTLEVRGPGAPDIQQAFFYEADQQIDAQADQQWRSLPDGFALTIPRNIQSPDSILESGPRLPNLRGILVPEGPDQPLGYAFDVPLDNQNLTALPPESHDPTSTPLSAEPTPAQKAAAARLYEPQARIDVVTLGGKKEAPLTIWSALLPAFLGGLILNLMPCVFPVLGLKITSFVTQGGSDPRHVRLHGLVFGAGVVLSMWVLAGLLLLLRSQSGQDFNWGAQLGEPAFVAAIVALLFLLGLNLAGVFEFGTSLTGVGANLQDRQGYSGSFFSGVLTTLIATPCSGPFLGTLMGFTLTQPTAIALNIFTVFALGLASPYIALSFFPAFISRLPRPGPWMVTFKILMAFALFASAAFFFRSFITQTGVDSATTFLFALVLLALAAWLYGRFFLPTQSPRTKLLWGGLTPLLIALAALTLTRNAIQSRQPLHHTQTTSHHPGEIAWQNWYPGLIEQSRSKKRIVWHDYTADW